MTLKTAIKHLHALNARLDDDDISKPERRAINEAIAWLAGERRRHARLDLRDKMLDHINGNINDNRLDNLRVATINENR